MADTVDPDPPPPPPEVTVTTPVDQPTPEVPPDAPPPRQGCMQKRTCIEKLLIAILIIVILLCLAFAACFVVYYLFAAPPEGTCLTTDCVSAASRLKSYMDEDMDPCNNFYEYACGGWLKTNVLKTGETQKSAMTMIEEANWIRIKGLLEASPRKNDSEYKEKPRAFYRSCMNENKLSKLGTKPFLKLIESIGKFPALDSSWNETTFNLEELLFKLGKLGIMPLIQVSVRRDTDDPRKNRLYIDPSAKMLESATDPNVMATRDILVGVLQLLGASPEVAAEDVEDIMEFGMKLWKLYKSQKEDTADNPGIIKPTTVALMDSKYPWLKWLEFLRGLGSESREGINEYIRNDEEVINRGPDFFEQLGELLKETPARVVTNYLMSGLIARFGFLIPSFKETHEDMAEEYFDIKSQPRWKTCAEVTTHFFREIVGRMYINKFFGKDAKQYMDTMMSDLRSAFGDMLSENAWMSADTRKNAIQKLDLMEVKVGYPDYVLDDSRLNSLHNGAPVDKYFETVVGFHRQRVIENLSERKRNPDRKKWMSYPADANFYYGKLDNDIAVPAAVLQAPVFDVGYPSSMNYGGIGFLIGQAMTHAFDDKGSKYNGDAEMVDWWTDTDTTKFKNEAQCFIDQYGCYKWDDLSLNGKLTLSENIADNGGLRQSFKAYRKYIERQGVEEQRLPGLDLDHDQVFFLGFAQTWCSKIQDELKEGLLKNDVRSPSQHRVYGTLQNSKDFAEAFKCEPGSRMNPMRKCMVW